VPGKESKKAEINLSSSSPGAAVVLPTRTPRQS